MQRFGTPRPKCWPSSHRNRSSRLPARCRRTSSNARKDRVQDTLPARALPLVDLDQVENPARLIRAGLLLIGALVLGIGVWMALAPLSGAVIAPGFIKVDMNRKTVQHQEGGIVSEILVRDGSRVKAGETLLVLRDVRVDSSQDLLTTQLDSEMAKAARLRAEQLLAPKRHLPAGAHRAQRRGTRSRAHRTRDRPLRSAHQCAQRADRPHPQASAGDREGNRGALAPAGCRREHDPIAEGRAQRQRVATRQGVREQDAAARAAARAVGVRGPAR